MTGASPSGNAGADYIETTDLEPLPNPAKSARTVVQGLKNSDWQVQFSAINVMRALAIKHASSFGPPLAKGVVNALMVRAVGRCSVHHVFVSFLLFSWLSVCPPPPPPPPPVA